MQINSTERVNRLYAANSVEGLNPVVKSDREGDKVSLSPQGLRASFMNDLGLDCLNDVLTIDGIRNAIERDQASVKQMLSGIAEDLGLTKSSFELSVGRDGNLVVGGNLPERAALEEILNNHSEFSQTFKRLSANSTLLKAAQEGLEFQQAYAADPQKAVEEFMHLLDDSRHYAFKLNYADGRVSSRVTTSYL